VGSTVHLRQKGRIELADFLLQPGDAILLVLLPQPFAQFGVYGGNIVQIRR
jgi:hypothetical protein